MISSGEQMKKSARLLKLIGQQSGRRIAILTWLTLWTVLPTNCAAQISVAVGNGEPMLRKGADWYLDTLAHVAWRRAQRKWAPVPDKNVISILPCHGFVHLQSTDHGTIWDASGMVASDYVHCFCSDSLRVIAYHGITIFYKPDGTDFHATHCGAAWKNQDTITGMRAFCVPLREATGQKMLDCSEIRDWGMIGSNGQWLIPPVYDGPFRFQNGFAEVIYYGRHVKINERGEQIE